MRHCMPFSCRTSAEDGEQSSLDVCPLQPINRIHGAFKNDVAVHCVPAQANCGAITPPNS